MEHAKKNNARHIWLTCVVVFMLMCIGVEPAIAYFTANDHAKGGYVLVIDNSTDIDEPEVISLVKHVVIKNTGNADTAVRVAAFCGSAYTLQFSGSGWMKADDDFLYYTSALAPGETSSELLISIGGMEQAGYEDGETFSVEVVKESVPAVYGEDGNLSLDLSWSEDAPKIVERGVFHA